MDQNIFTIYISFKSGGSIKSLILKNKIDTVRFNQWFIFIKS